MATLRTRGALHLVLAFAVAVALIIGTGIGLGRATAAPEEQPPMYDALAMPAGLPPLPISGVSRFFYGEGYTELTVNGQRVVLVGIPVMIYPSVEVTELELPGIEAQSFDSSQLEAVDTLLQARYRAHDETGY